MNFFTMLAHCDFEKGATSGTLGFGIFVLVACGVTLFLLRGMKPGFGWHILAMAVGVLIFEMFTGPMWLNERLGRFAYVYTDVSWILSIGWTTMILGVVLLVDRWKSGWSAAKRFALYLAGLLPLVLVAEVVLVNLGIRSYAAEVLEATSGVRVLDVPIEVLYYVPVFSALVITFYKYWSFVIEGTPLVPSKKRRWLRGLALAFVAVFLFELMVEPMAENRGFPAWSYLYRDISVLMSGLWVLVIAVGALVVDRFFLHQPVAARFFIALGVMGMAALAIESWLIGGGFRVYGPAATANFTGFTAPITGIAVEVAFAIPFYLALMVCFIRYWEVVKDNSL
jgi:hypothetical protein